MNSNPGFTYVIDTLGRGQEYAGKRVSDPIEEPGTLQRQIANRLAEKLYQAKLARESGYTAHKDFSNIH